MVIASISAFHYVIIIKIASIIASIYFLKDYYFVQTAFGMF